MDRDRGPGPGRVAAGGVGQGGAGKVRRRVAADRAVRLVLDHREARRESDSEGAAGLKIVNRIGVHSANQHFISIQSEWADMDTTGIK